MNSNDEAVVHVDFEINSKDLFRASIELAKRRFMIGILIFAILIIALVSFFMMIDEQEILLETSPLFIGVPL